MTEKAAKIAHPCLVSPTIFPKVYVNAAGITKIRNMASRLLNGFGFSNGWEEFALKKPPPFVPSCLIASCEATGP